ncbi:MAG TPA: LacI family DNA-binding transcriptional regulator [Cerasibacillus sp.]|uniref:LacI family DNA-binding transcriptional regulator n=1 Tax=Cerasibacillus sp. TaxID=2498711 RepID=UPI002F42F132
MSVTIYDVAKAADVSIATVSKVINKKGRISDLTRERVLKVMEELDYRPSVLASALMGKNTNTLGLLIPDIINPFFAELSRHIEDRANELEYNVIICNTDYQQEKEKNYIQLLKQKSVDGFILASGFEDPTEVERLIEEEIPVVIVAREFPLFSVNGVALNDYIGGQMAAKHLVDRGHQNIGIIARDLWSNRERVRGFCDYLQSQGLEKHPEFEFIRDDNLTHIITGKKAAEHYLTKNSRPSAIFACNDLLAAGAIQATRLHGLRIPEDIAIVGFDDTTLTRMIDPPLTTVAQPIEQMGNEIVDLMLGVIDGSVKGEKHITLMPSMKVRETT